MTTIKIYNLSSDSILQEKIDEIETETDIVAREMFRGIIIEILSEAIMKSICFWNWFGTGHKPDHKGACRYCGMRC